VIVFTFLLGIANFALHKAVLESRHPMLLHTPQLLQKLTGRFSLVLEFVMLAGSLLMVAHGATGWGWFYAGYSAANAISAWLILSRRI
jgi:hypothetical protein